MKAETQQTDLPLTGDDFRNLLKVRYPDRDAAFQARWFVAYQNAQAMLECYTASELAKDVLNGTPALTDAFVDTWFEETEEECLIEALIGFYRLSEQT